jgi:hypothetical protein
MINEPIYKGKLQSDLDFAGFNPVNLTGWPPSGGVGGGEFNVKTYGATGDGTTDDTVAIQAALAAIPSTGGVLYFPAGQYEYAGAGLTLDRKITVRGDGGGVKYVQLGPPIIGIHGQLAITTIDFNSSTGTLFTVTTSGCAFRSLCLRNTSGTTPSAGAGIVVTSGDHLTFDGITVDGFYIDIDVQNGMADTFDNCFLIAPVLYGLKLRHILVPDGGDHAISNCNICSAGGRSTATGIRIESGGGIKIINTKIVCTFEAGGTISYFVNGIDLAVGNNVFTSDLLVSNCSIEGMTGYGIKGTTGATSSTWGNIVITGNQLSEIGDSAINLSATTSGDFPEVIITGNYGSITPSALSVPMIYLTNCSNVSLTGNAQQTGQWNSLIGIGSGVTYAPYYISPDLRFVPITGGAKIQVRNAGTNAWVDADQWTNP